MSLTHACRGLSAVGVIVVCLSCRWPVANASSADDFPSPDVGLATAGDGPNSDDSLAQVTPGTKSATPSDSTAKPRPSAKPAEKRVAPPESSPKPLPPEPTSPPSNELASLLGDQNESRGSESLARTPNMFGNFFNNLGGSVIATAPGPFGTTTAQADLPLAAGCRRVKIAEDDNALPQDRVFFLYNHFQDALHADADLGGVGPFSRNFSVDCYTFGLEKTFFDQKSSIEVRMPLAGRTDFSTPDFGVSGGNVGNLAVIVKRLVYRCDTLAVSIGLGIDTPTGSDATGFAEAPLPVPKTAAFVVHNDAVHLLPYAGFVNAPSERFFWEGFVQVDVATNPNRVDYQNNRGPGTGELSEQNLLYLDLAGGYWLYRNPCGRHLTGVAGMVELHYTTALQDSDVVAAPFPPFPSLAFSNFANRVDVLDLTVGIHSELTKSALCRVGAVVPLRTGDDRSFDSELQVQLEWRF
jgi:hypothetical protein